MKIEKENVRINNVSCNFCNRGELSNERVALLYPYETVYTFGRSEGNGLCASICDECLDELIEKRIKLTNNNQ